MVDPAIKYGGGHEEYLKLFLATASAGIAEHETREYQVLDMQRNLLKLLAKDDLTDEIRSHIISLQETIATVQADLEAHRQKGVNLFRDAVQFVEENFRSK